MTALNLGRGDLMAIAAFRYCLGRRTYIVGDCADWLIEQWGSLDQKARAVIERDLREEVKRDDEARAENREYKPLGQDCDRADWLRVLAFIDSNAINQAQGGTHG